MTEMRRAQKLWHKLGGDPADGDCPAKPKRMRWTTYNRLMGKLIAAERVVDDMLVARWLPAKKRN